MSGVIDDMNSHHKPIIAMFNLCMPMNKNSSDQKLLQHYSFSKKNVDTLITDLESKKDILAISTNKYYCTKIMDNQGDSKITWEFINELRGKCKKP